MTDRRSTTTRDLDDRNRPRRARHDERRAARRACAQRVLAELAGARRARIAGRGCAFALAAAAVAARRSLLVVVGRPAAPAGRPTVAGRRTPIARADGAARHRAAPELTARQHRPRHGAHDRPCRLASRRGADRDGSADSGRVDRHGRGDGRSSRVTPVEPLAAIDPIAHRRLDAPAEHRRSPSRRSRSTHRDHAADAAALSGIRGERMVRRTLQPHWPPR